MNLISMLPSGTVWRPATRLVISAALPALLLTMSESPLSSQSTLPTRLLQQGDLVHQGSFTLPDVQDPLGRDGFAYVKGTLAFNPANQSLFMVGHTHGQLVAEINIPALGGQATVRQAFRDPIEERGGRINPANGTRIDYQIGGMWVAGDKLIVSTYVYYDGAGTAIASHFVRDTTLSTSSVQGPFKVGSGYAGDHAGYFAGIPPEWQSALGGTLLNGACCHAIASLWSWGPSIGVVNPADLLAGRNPSPATMLLHYPDTHPYTTRTEQSSFYNGTTEVAGAVLPAGTRTLLFFGKHGMGPPTYISGGGPSAPPYQPHVWAYDVNELIAVKNRKRRPWEPRPYATFRMPGLEEAALVGVTDDPATGRIFVAEYHGDGVKGRVHVFTISATPAPPSAPPPRNR